MSEQKVGIVTGAARPWGMGYQIAMGLARKGLDIAVIDVREDWGAQAVADLTRETGRRAIFVKTDITRRADVAAMAERVAGELGRIDALVNNAGIVMNEMVEGMTDEGIDSQINVNLKGTALCCQAVIPYMRKAGGGRVVNIASGGAFEPLRKLAIYSATKAAVIAFSKVMAKEVARDNIVVTVVAPESCIPIRVPRPVQSRASTIASSYCGAARWIRPKSPRSWFTRRLIRPMS